MLLIFVADRRDLQVARKYIVLAGVSRTCRPGSQRPQLPFICYFTIIGLSISESLHFATFPSLAHLSYKAITDELEEDASDKSFQHFEVEGKRRVSENSRVLSVSH